MMNRHPSNRRISAVAISSRNSLLRGREASFRRCQTTTTATVVRTNHNSAETTDPVDRADRVRSWVVGFLGRKLSLEEEDLLQEDVAKFVSATETDQEAARRVVQTLLTFFFLQEQHLEEDAGPMTRTSSSIHLEAEAMQVETMAVLKIQACARGRLQRRIGAPLWLAQRRRTQSKKWSATKTTTTAAEATKTTSSQDVKQASMNQGTVGAAVVLQKMIRRYLVAKKKQQQQQQQQQQQREQQREQQIPNTIATWKTAPKGSREIITAETSKPRVSLALGAITEMDAVTTFGQDPASNPASNVTKPHDQRRENLLIMMDDSSSSNNPSSSTSLMDDGSLNTNSTHIAQGMKLWTESHDELICVTEVVKINIVVKVQALVRSFLVRRRKRRLRKARSLRALQSRPSLLLTTKGTLREHTAATAIQRTLRGYVQRWKYWTAMRQQQLLEIQSLKSKQLRKIAQRKKIMLKTTKKELFFDAERLARQLQRAKRAIKFLVKEEKRSVQQYEQLKTEWFELLKANQWLTNATETSTTSVATLQTELQQLQAKEQKLRATKQDYEQTVEQWTRESKQAEVDFQQEEQKKREIQACLTKIKQRAYQFFQEQPGLEEDLLAAAKASIMKNPKNHDNNTQTTSNGQATPLPQPLDSWRAEQQPTKPPQQPVAS